MVAYDDAHFVPPAPVATVTLRHLETGLAIAGVPMVIDSGADVSLIPNMFAQQIGASAKLDVGYEVMGFDGTKSTAQAVDLDLVFLRRTFKGRFLLIDHPCGMLGRDVLNHVAIVLDGPGLVWSEHARPM